MKPRVFIVGLLPSQADMVAREFSQALDLAFAKKDALGEFIKARAARADMVVAMAGFIAHAHDAILRKACAGRYQKCPGGMTRLRSILSNVGKKE